MSDSAEERSSLHARLAEAWPDERRSCHGVFTSGHSALDAYLGGGFERGQLHEVFADSGEDNGCATAFAAMLALRGMQSGKSILWLRTISATRKGGRFNPAGFAELGGDPSALLMAVAPDETALLRSAVDALRCSGFGMVVIECWGSPAILDLTASRRLTLAADRSGVVAILLRLDAREQPSTASTRWAVRSALSTPLEANAPGHPALDLTLLRRRAGPSGKSWQLEWDRDGQIFRQPERAEPAVRPRTAPPLHRPVVPLSGVRQATAGKRVALIS